MLCYHILASVLYANRVPALDSLRFHVLSSEDRFLFVALSPKASYRPFSPIPGTFSRPFHELPWVKQLAQIAMGHLNDCVTLIKPIKLSNRVSIAIWS